MTNSTINGSVTYATFGAMDDFFQDWEAKVDIPSFAQTISTAIDSAISPTSLEKLLTLQYDLLKSGVTNAESIVESTVMFGLGPTNLLVTPFWLLMPFSRGNVHITSPDPKVFPAINPNFFLVSFDLDVQVAIAKWTRKFWATEPMKSLVVSEVTPGFDVLPANATDAEWAQWIKTSTASNSHPLGTAAMLPRELGGVVDERLRVYGTGNVRVVDASVMPFQVSGHLSGTIYAIAEKAAVMIKEDVVG